MAAQSFDTDPFQMPDHLTFLLDDAVAGEATQVNVPSNLVQKMVVTFDAAAGFVAFDQDFVDSSTILSAANAQPIPADTLIDLDMAPGRKLTEDKHWREAGNRITKVFFGSATTSTRVHVTIMGRSE